MTNIFDRLTFIENKLVLDDFLRLKEEAFGDMDCHRQTSRLSLKGSLYAVHVELEGEVIAMARVLGDGDCVFYFADVIVTPLHQSKGIGKKMVQMLIEYVQSQIPEGGNTMIDLASDVDKERFYEKFGFISRPNERQGHGMQLRLDNINKNGD